jgi:carbohydrate diacid regulator
LKYEFSAYFTHFFIHVGGIMLTKQLANQIVEQTMIRLHRNINVMDTNGMILASGDEERVEKIHEGALYVANTQKPLWITEKNKHKWPGSKPGINMPVYFQQRLVGIIGITGNPNVIKEVATLVELTTEMMIHQSLIVSQSSWKRKMKEMVFEELISLQPFHPVLFERLAKLDFSLQPPYFTVLVEVVSSSSLIHSAVEQLEYYFEKNAVLVGHSQLNELFILTSGIDEMNLKRKLEKLPSFLKNSHPIRLGVGKSVQAIEDVHESFSSAKLALQYGNPSKEINYFEEVEVFSLLKNRNSAETNRFSGRILKGLNEKDCITLTEYFKCDQQLNICSNTLQIHRHTLSYRLRKIHDTTGYNPYSFQDGLILQIALWLKGDDY